MMKADLNHLMSDFEADCNTKRGQARAKKRLLSFRADASSRLNIFSFVVGIR